MHEIRIKTKSNLNESINLRNTKKLLILIETYSFIRMYV